MLKQGARQGCQPRRTGRNSHDPLLAVLAEAPFILHGWWRSGNTGAARGVVPFRQERSGKFAQLRFAVVGILAGDLRPLAFGGFGARRGSLQKFLDGFRDVFALHAGDGAQIARDDFAKGAARKSSANSLTAASSETRRPVDW